MAKKCNISLKDIQNFGVSKKFVIKPITAKEKSLLALEKSSQKVITPKQKRELLLTNPQLKEKPIKASQATKKARKNKIRGMLKSPLF